MSPNSYHASTRSPVVLGGVILLLILVVCSDVFLLATASEGESGSTGSSGSSGQNRAKGTGPPTPHSDSIDPRKQQQYPDFRIGPVCIKGDPKNNCGIHHH